MPGLNFVCNPGGDLGDESALCDAVLAEQALDSGYKTEVLTQGAGYVLSCFRYDEYPVESFENDRYRIVLEGRVYNRCEGALGDHLFDLASLTFDNEFSSGKLTDWLVETEGEFLIFLVDKKSGRVRFVNDVFSLLPVHYHISEHKVVVSRDIGFVRKMTQTTRFSKRAIAESLVFGYPLQDRTLFEDIFRLGPGCMIRIDMPEVSVCEDSGLAFNFDVKRYSGRSRKENVSELVSLFKQACRDRFGSGEKVLLSLSGGRDSRAIAAALGECGISYRAATFVDTAQVAALDADIAGKLARAFGVDWKLYQLAPSSGRMVGRLLRAKQGQFSLGHAYKTQYYERLIEDYGRDSIFVTGNGGDKTMPDLRPDRRIKRIDELVDCVIMRDKIMPVALAANLAGMSEHDLKAQIKEVFDTYPEETLEGKHMHFKVCERGFKLLLEGLDMARPFLWSASPFWSVKFFDYAMNCPDRQKKYDQLYAMFLSRLLPSGSRVGYARNNVSSLTSVQHGKSLAVRLASTLSGLPNPIRFVRKRIGGKKKAGSEQQDHEHAPEIIDCLRRQIDRCDVLKEYLAVPALLEALDNRGKYRTAALTGILTLTSIIEEVTTGTSSIDLFDKDVFDIY